jgi:primosomal protein N''
MTMEALRRDYETVYKALTQEKRMREHVFRNEPEKLRRKVGEIDDALAALARLKDTAKVVVIEAEQGRLLPEESKYP